MAPRLQDVLRKMADELDSLETEEKNADSEKERKEIHDEVIALREEIAQLKATPPVAEPPVTEPPVTEPPATEPPVDEPKDKKRTRPGRKSGQLYQDWPDEETGELVRLDIPRVYTGEDEADEVEIKEAS